MQSVVRFGWALYAGTRNISVLSTGVRGDRPYSICLLRVRGMDMSRSRVSDFRLIAGAIPQYLALIYPSFGRRSWTSRVRLCLPLPKSHDPAFGGGGAPEGMVEPTPG